MSVSLERERVLGGDVESAGGVRGAVGEDDGDAGLDVDELLTVAGVEDWYSGAVADSLRNEP